MVKLTNENAFVGAEIYKGTDKFYIYKVNEKSFYCGKVEASTMAYRWENRVKGLTFKALMEQHGGKLEKYEGFLIDETIPQQLVGEPAPEKKKKFLTTYAEREVKKLYSRYKNGKGSYRHLHTIDKEMFTIISANQQNQVLLSVDGYFVFFDLDTSNYTPWRRVTDRGSTAINWPKKGPEFIKNA